jgi:hypothetical protein
LKSLRISTLTGTLIGIVLGSSLTALGQQLALHESHSHESKAFLLRERLQVLKDFAAASESGIVKRSNALRKVSAAALSADTKNKAAFERDVAQQFLTLTSEGVPFDLRRSAVAANALFGPQTKKALADCSSCEGPKAVVAIPQEIATLLEATKIRYERAFDSGRPDEAREVVAMAMSDLDMRLVRRLKMQHDAVIEAMSAELWLGIGKPR